MDFINDMTKKLQYDRLFIKLFFTENKFYHHLKEYPEFSKPVIGNFIFNTLKMLVKRMPLNEAQLILNNHVNDFPEILFRDLLTGNNITDIVPSVSSGSTLLESHLECTN